MLKAGGGGEEEQLKHTNITTLGDYKSILDGTMKINIKHVKDYYR